MPNGVRTVAKHDASELLRIEFNKLRAAFDALCAKLDADSGVADTNYASTLVDAEDVDLL